MNEQQIIETIDEQGNTIRFELVDVVEFEDQEYALLFPEENKENEDELVLMRLMKDGEDYLFETIDNEDEFEKVAQYIESLDDEDEE